MTAAALTLLFAANTAADLNQQPHVVLDDTLVIGDTVLSTVSFERLQITTLSDDLRTPLQKRTLNIGAHLEQAERCVYSVKTGMLLMQFAQLHNSDVGDYVWSEAKGLVRLNPPKEWTVIDYSFRGDLVATLCWRPMHDEDRLRFGTVFGEGMLSVLYWRDGSWSRPFRPQPESSSSPIREFPWVSLAARLAEKHRGSSIYSESFWDTEPIEDLAPVGRTVSFSQPTGFVQCLTSSEKGLRIMQAKEDLTVNHYADILVDWFAPAVRFLNNKLYLLDSDDNFWLVSKQGTLLSSRRIRAIVDIVTD